MSQVQILPQQLMNIFWIRGRLRFEAAYLRSKLLPLCKKAQCAAQAFVTFSLAHINLLGSCLNPRSWIGVSGAGYQPIYSFFATLI